uniref:CHHC U11-48K-type domain-containing protein n=1 Tax=Anopheles funestus TaxID=62324 RepID=A0A182RD34_ANOFN
MDDFESVIDLLECPYNSAHKLLTHTMARHVSRCRRTYGVLKIVQCPFNPEHQVPELEMTLHKLECEDREAFEQYKFCFTSLISPTKMSPPKAAPPPAVLVRAKDTTDLLDNSPRRSMSTRRRTLCGAPVPSPTPTLTPPVSIADRSFSRVYDLRTSCRTGRKDWSCPSASPSIDRKLPVAAVTPLPKSPKIPTLIRAPKYEKENNVIKTPNLRKFRTPMKISERKLSIEDFRQRWKQVHNERRAQSRSRDRSARRSCYH